MLGEIIAQLDRPDRTAAVLAALDDPQLTDAVVRRADEAGFGTAEFVAQTVRYFLDHADEERWLQLVGAMTRADDPALAALHAILRTSVAS
jgi:hypothetical protein